MQIKRALVMGEEPIANSSAKMKECGSEDLADATDKG